MKEVSAELALQAGQVVGHDDVLVQLGLDLPHAVIGDVVPPDFGEVGEQVVLGLHFRAGVNVKELFFDFVSDKLEKEPLNRTSL